MDKEFIAACCSRRLALIKPNDPSRTCVIQSRKDKTKAKEYYLSIKRSYKLGKRTEKEIHSATNREHITKKSKNKQSSHEEFTSNDKNYLTEISDISRNNFDDIESNCSQTFMEPLET